MHWLTAGFPITIALSGLSTAVAAQPARPIEIVRALGLDSADVGGIRVRYAPSDREHALQLAALCEEVVSYFKGKFGPSFSPQLAVLRPEHWFVPYAGGEGEPYGIPWGWIPDLLIAVPASLEEGVLITGSDRSANLRRVRFVMLHEFGHLASKQLLHPESGHPYSSVRWFDELIATYFAYAFVRASDPDWARRAQDEWQSAVKEFTPPVVSLDWSHFRDLSPAEFARTYAWYQNLLNLYAATLYEQHGLDFLRSVRDRLDWQNAANWTTDGLIPVLDGIAPGFQAWASALGRMEPTQHTP
jgi:hypothetical protein